MSNLVSEGRVIVPNKASVFRVTEDYEPGMFVLNCASVPAKNIYASAVLNLSRDRTFLETYFQPHMKPGY